MPIALTAATIAPPSALVRMICNAFGRPRPAAFLDDGPKHNRIFDIPVITGLELPEPTASVIVAVGDNFLRATLAARYSTFAVAIHPSAQVSRHAEIGPGSVVMAGAVV